MFEQLLQRHRMDVLLSKEIVHVAAIGPQELESVRMIVLDRLRHVDDVQLVLVEQHVELAEIRVDEFAVVVHSSHHQHAVQVEFARLLLV